VPARILVEVELDFHDKTLAQIEAELMAQLRTALSPAFQTELAAAASRVPSGRCVTCGRERRRRGQEKRIVSGLFGRLELERHRVSCGRCGGNAYPADETLGLDPGEHYTLGVAEAALWLATESSYQKSAASLAQLLAGGGDQSRASASVGAARGGPGAGDLGGVAPPGLWGRRPTATDGVGGQRRHQGTGGGAGGRHLCARTGRGRPDGGQRRHRLFQAGDGEQRPPAAARQADLRRGGRHRRLWGEAGAAGSPAGRVQSQTTLLRQRRQYRPPANARRPAAGRPPSRTTSGARYWPS